MCYLRNKFQLTKQQVPQKKKPTWNGPSVPKENLGLKKSPNCKSPSTIQSTHPESSRSPDSPTRERAGRPKPTNSSPPPHPQQSCRTKNPAAGAREAVPPPPATAMRTSRARPHSRRSSSPTASRSNSAPSPSSAPRYSTHYPLPKSHTSTISSPALELRGSSERALAPPLSLRRCCCRWCTCR